MTKTPAPTADPGTETRRWLEMMLASAYTYIGIGLLILLLDLVTGPYLMFPIFFVIPVTLAAWYRGPSLSLSLSALLPIGRYFIAVHVDHPTPYHYAWVNALIRIVVLAFIAVLVSRTARQTRALSRELKHLQGILPICMYCKRIRNENQEWERLESYISEHSEANFSHGMCAECAKQDHGDIFSGRGK